METLAVLRALQFLKVPSVVVIHTDSQYIIDGFKRLSRNQLLKSHYDIWGLLLHYIQIHHVHLSKVKAHSGVEGNELADKHAKYAARNQIGDFFMSPSEFLIERVRKEKKLDERQI
jgi:ribonuclease HI